MIIKDKIISSIPSKMATFLKEQMVSTMKDLEGIFDQQEIFDPQG